MPAPARDIPPSFVRIRIRAGCLVSDPTLARYFRDLAISPVSRKRIETALRELGMEDLIRPEPKPDSGDRSPPHR